MNNSLLFRRLMENISESVFFKDSESRFIAINKACAEKFGLEDPEEAVGKTDFDFFDDEHARPAFEDEQQILKTEQAILDKVEKEVYKKAGKETWTSTSKFPLYDDDGNLVGTYGITKDVTIEKEVKDKLKKSNHQFKKLSEQVPGLFYLYQFFEEGNSCMPFASEAIEEIYELKPEDVKDSIEPVMKRVHPDDLRRVISSILTSVKKLQNWDCEFRVILPERGLRWMHGAAKPELQPDGSVIGYGYVTDITEERSILEANKKLRRQFESVFNSVPNLIFVKNKAGEYVMANNAAAEYMGESINGLIGKTDCDLGFPEEKVQMFRDMDQRVLENKELVQLPEDMSISPAGEGYCHQTIKLPFHLVGSDENAVLTIVTDVTERKRSELELQESLNIIGEQNKRLTNFAHIVSHNLRNHAGNISMLLSLYNDEETEEERAELLDFLKKASERLNETIKDLNEIVDQQYKKQTALKKVRLQDFVDKAKQVLTTEILKKNVEIEECIPEDMSFEYNPAYLESILLNMMSNAIKYRHPERTPKMKIKASEMDGHHHLEVSDNGLGLDLEKYGDKLFGMYKTFHENKNSKGIGLFITKNQIESMGGSIEVESEINKGTTFKIKLN
jgi:PAS domain S-box-containing protein